MKEKVKIQSNKRKSRKKSMLSENLFASVKESLITITEINKIRSLSNLKSSKCLDLKAEPKMLCKACRALCDPAFSISPVPSYLSLP